MKNKVSKDCVTNCDTELILKPSTHSLRYGGSHIMSGITGLAYNSIWFKTLYEKSFRNHI